MKNIIYKIKKLDIDWVFVFILSILVTSIFTIITPINLLSTIGIKDLLIIVVPLIVLSATLSLLSFTYLLVMHNIWGKKILIRDTINLNNLSYSDLKKISNNLSIKLNRISDKNKTIKIIYKKVSDNSENISEEDMNLIFNVIDKKLVEIDYEINNFKTEAKNVDKYLVNYKYKLILRSGEYFFISTLYIIFAFSWILLLYVLNIFVIIPNVSDLIFNLGVLFVLFSIFYFIKGVVTTSMFLGHLSLVK